MLELYSLNVNVEENGSIPFNNINIAKGSTATHNAPGTISLNKAGVYMVSVSASITPTTTGDVSIQLAKDNVLQLGAFSVEDGTAAETTALAFDTLVQVRSDNTCCCNTSPTTLQLINTGEAGTFPIVKMVITKIC